MKRINKVQITHFKFFVFTCSLLTFSFLLPPVSHAKVYIDITSPAFRKLPLSIHSSGSTEAKKISEIVYDDLELTGIFDLIDPEIPGAEMKVNITANSLEKIKADVSVSDLIKNKDLLNKRYSSSKSILRSLSHTIADDIFEAVTGKKGIFRTKLTYIVSSAHKRWLYFMDWDGKNPKKIVARGLTTSHTWSPDSRYVFFSSERKRKWKIYSLNMRNYSERTLFSSKGLNVVGGVSPDNRISFSSSLSGSPEIYVMNMYGGAAQKITKSFGIDISPVFSPDGSRIAFVSDRGGSPQIYVMNSDGSRLRRLTFEGSYNTSPAWSPDGKWIVFVGRKNGKNQLFMIQSDGKDLHQITEKGNNENPTFSPNGIFIAFDSDRAGQKAIYLMNVNSGFSKRITPKNIKAMNPKWSPHIK
jgi:TolB protein